MATDHEMREHLKKAYPHSGTWPAKVAQMHPNQVFALFSKFRAEGKIK